MRLLGAVSRGSGEVNEDGFGVIGTPDDVAGLALFLASDASSYCTGGVYMVDGGYLT